ncbi:MULTISPECIES: ATP-binding protein [unclassified Streptomyces]|uniref:sensor histidine kinase n=1 Tax=unclassified Streptomyces TaxID=2593676 RepID=UPI000DBA3EAE|nr:MULTISPECIES: ATP-binding protein [unclassified Streptomyces]MYT74567.1 ATP-binding protein [Streptomyces sp. SID8367]RAJ91550.1 signal transduction histidine kinase [Streptomyces sp. PsTaAH-137]
MSQLRQPAPRADRREGARHGKPAGRAAAPRPAETHIRPQLLRIAVLPPLAVALGACAAVIFLVRSTGVRPSTELWAVLTGACVVTTAAILIAAVAADRTAGAVHDRVVGLRRASARGQAELRGLVEQLRRGEDPPPRRTPKAPPPGADDFDKLSADLARAQDVAVTAVVQATQLSSQAGSRQKVEVFVNLARRLQSLVHREISILDELENDVEDPDLLKGLFHVDHLATRIRRHAENLAVLGGAVSRRQWSHPVSMTEVMRSAVAEVEQYSRVKLVPPIDGTLRGHAVADCIHLLAELVENATVFSAPHTQVLLRANLVTSGLAIEVEDRGLGMPVTEQNKMNALLTDPDQVNVASLLQDGRIGLFVVSQLARRHGITVRLQTNIYGGVQAILVVPQDLLGAEDGERAPRVRKATAAATADSVLGPQAAAAVTSTPPARQAPPAPPQPPVAVPHRPETAPAPPDAPRPLPQRVAGSTRPTPADALPGISAEDREAAEQSAEAPPTPLAGPVRGTTERPQLPRRRAQEHLAPQLRGGPAPRQDDEPPAGHDPGLMAAFQRGITLAEAADPREIPYRDPLGGAGSGT